MERGRKVQSIVPDMRISIPEEGNFVQRLHELKIISSSKTRYNPHRQGQEAMRAVDKRASELNGEYITKARNTDRRYCGTAQDATGPVETKLGTLLEVKGLVVEAFGEGSDPPLGDFQGEGGWPSKGEEGPSKGGRSRVGFDYFLP